MIGYISRLRLVDSRGLGFCTIALLGRVSSPRHEPTAPTPSRPDLPIGEITYLLPTSCDVKLAR